MRALGCVPNRVPTQVVELGEVYGYSLCGMSGLVRDFLVFELDSGDG